MVRLLLIGIALFLFYKLVLTKFLRPSNPPTSKEGGHLVQCHTCHTWVAKEEVLQQEGRSYCSSACAQRDTPQE